MTTPCQFCGAPLAPFGFGLPGLRSDKPERKRGYLWTCSEHRPDGERRREAGIAAYHGRAAPSHETTTSEAERGPHELPQE